MSAAPPVVVNRDVFRVPEDASAPLRGDLADARAVLSGFGD